MAKLIVVPTPIGNLKDITLRALEVLREAQLILAEDTRKTGFLLHHFEIKNTLAPFHKFNEHKQLEHVLQRIQGNEITALVSDAGTPAISDPGYLLVRACVQQGIEVECLPGATALIPALVNSGLPSDRFSFEGFLPHKKGKKTKLENLRTESRTMLFYESPHRLVKTLSQILEIFQEERQVCVCRELTKLHEEIFRGNLSQTIEHFNAKDVKGEIVFVLEGYTEKKKNKHE